MQNAFPVIMWYVLQLIPVSASESGTDGGDDDSVAASKQEEQPRRRQVHWEKYAILIEQ